MQQWAAEYTLRLQAAWRHWAQACLRGREWVPSEFRRPKAGVRPASASTASPSMSGASPAAAAGASALAGSGAQGAGVLGRPAAAQAGEARPTLRRATPLQLGRPAAALGPGAPPAGRPLPARVAMPPLPAMAAWPQPHGPRNVLGPAVAAPYGREALQHICEGVLPSSVGPSLSPPVYADASGEGGSAQPANVAGADPVRGPPQTPARAVLRRHSSKTASPKRWASPPAVASAAARVPARIPARPATRPAAAASSAGPGTCRPQCPCAFQYGWDADRRQAWRAPAGATGLAKAPEWAAALRLPPDEDPEGLMLACFEDGDVAPIPVTLGEFEGALPAPAPRAAGSVRARVSRRPAVAAPARLAPGAGPVAQPRGGKVAAHAAQGRVAAPADAVADVETVFETKHALSGTMLRCVYQEQKGRSAIVRLQEREAAAGQPAGAWRQRCMLSVRQAQTRGAAWRVMKTLTERFARGRLTAELLYDARDKMLKEAAPAMEAPAMDGAPSKRARVQPSPVGSGQEEVVDVEPNLSPDYGLPEGAEGAEGAEEESGGEELEEEQEEEEAEEQAF